MSNNETLFCLTPALPEEPSISDVKGYMRLAYGFIFDSVNYTEMQGAFDENHAFQLFPNPQYEPFKEPVKTYRSDYLTINVSNIFHPALPYNNRYDYRANI